MTILYWKLTYPLPAGTFKSFIFRLLEALQQHIWSLLRLGQGPGLDQRSGRWGLNSHVFLVKTDRVDVIFDYHLFEWKCDEYVMLHVWICAFCDQKTFMMWHWMLYSSCQAMLDTWCLSDSDHSCPTNCKQVYHVLPNKACLWDFFSPARFQCMSMRKILVLLEMQALKHEGRLKRSGHVGPAEWNQTFRWS